MRRQARNEIEEKLSTAAGLLEQGPLSGFHRDAALALLRECLAVLHTPKKNGGKRSAKETASPASEFDRFIRNEERRAFQRWPVKLPALCTTSRGVEDCNVLDLSEAGLAMKVGRALRLGTQVVVDCELPHEGRIHVRGVARRLHGKVVAVQYRGISRADRVKILDFINQHELAGAR